MRTLAKCWACVLPVYVALYSLFIRNTWMGLDDEILLRQNSHLGLGIGSWIWGMLDVNFGRRWTPMLWTVANIVGTPSALKFHLLVFALGFVLVALVTMAFVENLGAPCGVVASLLFVVTPMRCEVFGWEMGFVYETVGIWVVLAWLCRRSPYASCLCLVFALLAYPIAAGPALLGIYYHRRSNAVYFLLFFICWLAKLQMGLRRSIGFIPWHEDFYAWWLVAPHYAFNQFVPFSNLPVFPAVFYVWIPVGFAVLLVTVVYYPRFALAWLVLLGPVVLASITESFWFGARYSLLPEILGAWGIGWALRRYWTPRLVYLVPLWICALLALNVSQAWMWQSAVGVVEGVYYEGVFAGRDFTVFVRSVKWRTRKEYRKLAPPMPLQKLGLKTVSPVLLVK